MRPAVPILLLAIAVAVPASASTAIDLPGQAPDEIVRASTRAQEPPGPDVDVEVHKGETRHDSGWYVHPLTIGIFVLALLGIAFLAVTLNRGRGREGRRIAGFSGEKPPGRSA